MTSRHLAAEFPADLVPAASTVLHQRSTAVVALGDLTDADASTLVAAAQSPSTGIFLAEHYRLDESTTPEQLMEVLVVLAGMGMFSSAADGRHIHMVCASGGNRGFAREYAAALALNVKSRYPKSSLKVVRLGKVRLGARAPGESSRVSEEVQQRVNDVLAGDSTAPGYAFAARFAPVVPRDMDAAREAVRRLLSREASERIIGEHLRAYGYLNERQKVGEWPVDRVKKVIAGAKAETQGTTR